MPRPLDGELAVVTGAGKGIGEAIAVALADAGARVAVTSRRAEDAERVASALGAGHAGVGMDVSSSTAVAAAVGVIVDALGEPTVLVNNAGVNRIGPAETYADDDWELAVERARHGPAGQCITQPPSIPIIWPVMNEEASEARNVTRLPMSSGVPRRFSACRSRMRRV